MAESHGPGHDAKPPEGFDKELHYSAIWKFTIFVAAAMFVSMALMWGLYSFLKKGLVSTDPPPPALAGARVQPPPPAPRLQPEPPKDLRELRRREDAVLSGYAWVSREKGTAQIPVDRAIEIVAEKGLPVPPTATPGPAPAPGAPK